jgi:hypothetical protein
VEEAGCILISLLIAAAITGILAIAKVAIPLAAMGWFWVWLPLIIWAVVVLGVVVIGGDGDIF